MQPMVLSVTLVSAWSRSGGYACIHANTHTHTYIQYRHTRFHIPKSSLSYGLHVVTSLTYSSFYLQFTSSSLKSSRKGLNMIEYVRQCISVMRPF